MNLMSRGKLQADIAPFKACSHFDIKFSLTNLLNNLPDIDHSSWSDKLHL